MDRKASKLIKSIAMAGLVTGGLLLGSQAYANDGKAKAKADDHHDEQGKCWGVNACKGKGKCGGRGATCAGHNACKGKGWVKKTHHDCTEAKGEFEALKKS